MWPFNVERYNSALLYIYNILVLSLVNTYIWRCPTKENMLALYKQRAGRRHCDIGIGTGYYLDHLDYADDASVDLIDIETTPLSSTQNLLRRRNPRLPIHTHVRDILSDEKLPGDVSYDSVGLTYLWHCLPGPASRKARIFSKIEEVVSPGGVVFGATVLGRGPWHGWSASCLVRVLNWIGQFDNMNDTKDTVQKGLEENFRDVKTWIVGSVLLFEATKSTNNK
ncbi:hypothetical protein EV356DRAFT_476415 [Viridothelium virens]|uniref:Methyltransferase domain-containing protein n=1 Tax=Viridothelium virens TaxID=1048519 RepID=A0A6A6GU84_VIRVR|nr:hypothetical protein EV356DRAFT_476415 [Viridothelium virens]